MDCSVTRELSDKQQHNRSFARVDPRKLSRKWCGKLGPPYSSDKFEGEHQRSERRESGHNWQSAQQCR